MKSVPTAPTTPPKLLTVPEVAERLRVSQWSVYRRIACGDISAVRLGHSQRSPLRVDPTELDEYIYGNGGRS